MLQTKDKVESFINLDNVASFTLDKTNLDFPALDVSFNDGRDYRFRLTINEYMHFIECLRDYNDF
jgi:hypothetical protein